MGGESRGHARIVNSTCEALNFARRGAMQVRVQQPRRNNRQRFLEEVALGRSGRCVFQHSVRSKRANTFIARPLSRESIVIALTRFRALSCHS